jgi:hypothetical protein
MSGRQALQAVVAHRPHRSHLCDLRVQRMDALLLMMKLNVAHSIQKRAGMAAPRRGAEALETSTPAPGGKLKGARCP